MSIELLIYVADLADRVPAIIVIAVSVIIGALIFAGVNMLDKDDDSSKTVDYCKKIGHISAIIVVVCFFIPSQKTIYMMAGASIGREVAQSDIAIKVKKIIESKLNDYVKELEKKGE
jgi:uncharacterized membrane protein